MLLTLAEVKCNWPVAWSATTCHSEQPQAPKSLNSTCWVFFASYSETKAALETRLPVNMSVSAVTLAQTNLTWKKQRIWPSKTCCLIQAWCDAQPTITCTTEISEMLWRTAFSSMFRLFMRHNIRVVLNMMKMNMMYLFKLRLSPWTLFGIQKASVSCFPLHFIQLDMPPFFGIIFWAYWKAKGVNTGMDEGWDLIPGQSWNVCDSRLNRWTSSGHCVIWGWAGLRQMGGWAGGRHSGRNASVSVVSVELGKLLQRKLHVSAIWKVVRILCRISAALVSWSIINGCSDSKPRSVTVAVISVPKTFLFHVLLWQLKSGSVNLLFGLFFNTVRVFSAVQWSVIRMETISL